MQNKPIIWIATVSASVLAGAIAFYGNVRNFAVQALDKEGAFNAIRAQRTQSLANIYGPDVIARAPKALEKEFPINDPATKPAVQKINQRWWTQKRDIVHKKNVDNFSGAWSVLPASKKAQALGFSAVLSVAAGALTYVTLRPSKHRNRGEGYHEDFLDDGIDIFGGHHHGSGHGMFDGAYLLGIFGDAGHGF